MNARTIILIGAPGAGKTCQATALAQALPAKSVSPGQMLRDLKGQSVIGQYMQQFFVREALADIAWELIEREIVSAKNAGSSIVLEGTPREAKDTFLLQKKLFKNGLSNNVYVVLLNISAQDLANRNKIPRAGREAENMAARHKTFNEETGPLLKALQDQGLTPIHVDANGTPEEVTKKILDAIKGPGVEWKIDNVAERPTDIDAELNLVAEKCNAIENAECIMRLIGHSSTEDDKKRDAGQKRQPKFPGSHCNGLQPCHMDPQNRDAITFRDYCVTPKADGTRYLVVVVHNTSGLWLKLIDRNLHAHACFAPENKREGKEDGPGRMENVVTILDAELVRAKDSHAMLLVFDCLCVRNKCIVNHPLQHRVEEARSLVAELRKAGYSSSTRSQVVDVVMKAYEDAGSITADQFDGLLQADAFQFGSDGLILTPKGRYHIGFDRRLLKWKPLQEFTADFRVKKVGSPVVDPNNSAVQCVIMELFVMQGNGAEGSFGSRDNYGYLIASESVAQDIEQKVVELSWDSERQTLIPSDSKPLKGGWTFKRVRADKPKPNVASVVVSIVESIRHPELSVSLEALKKAMLDSQRERSDDRARGGEERRGGGGGFRGRSDFESSRGGRSYADARGEGNQGRGDFQRRNTGQRDGFRDANPHERQHGPRDNERQNGPRDNERRRPQEDLARERNDNFRPRDRDPRPATRSDAGGWRSQTRENEPRSGYRKPEPQKLPSKQTPSQKQPSRNDNMMAVLAADSDNEQPEQPEAQQAEQPQAEQPQVEQPVSKDQPASSEPAPEAKSAEYYSGVSRKETAVQPLLDWHNAIKRDLYKRFLTQRSSVLELAGGRGGDLWKVMACKPGEILLVDADQKALDDARGRWEGKYGTNKALYPILHLQQQDLRTPHSFLTKAGTRFDFASCHFALHYFFESAESWSAFLHTLDSSVKPGGHFITTLFDGEKVDALLKSSGGSASFCGGALGLSEVRAEGAVTIHLPQTDFGRAVQVQVDTIGSHVEYVVSLPRLTALLAEAGWELVEQKSFRTSLENGSFARAAGLSPMTDAEMATFSALNSTLVFRKRTQHS